MGNPIDNYTITQDFFDEIAALTNFNINPPNDSYTCENGTWQDTHDVKFCVLNDTTTSGGAFLASCVLSSIRIGVS